MAMAPKELHLKGMKMQANRPGFAQNGFDDLELVLTENDLIFGQYSDTSTKSSIVSNEMSFARVKLCAEFGPQRKMFLRLINKSLTKKFSRSTLQD